MLYIILIQMFIFSVLRISNWLNKHFDNITGNRFDLKLLTKSSNCDFWGTKNQRNIREV